MIQSFSCKETEKIFKRYFSRKLPLSIQQVALRKLWMIDAAQRIQDLSILPANKLEKLKGNLQGKYSLRINQQWRICFRWKAGNAYEVKIIDYH